MYDVQNYLATKAAGKGERSSSYSSLGINLWLMAVDGHWSCFESTVVNGRLKKDGHSELHQQRPELVSGR